MRADVAQRVRVTDLPPRDVRRARASIGTSPPSQRDLGDLLGVSGPAVHRLEHGRQRARGLVREVYLAILIACAAKADLSAALDRRRPRGERLAAVFQAAYQGAAK